MQSAHQSPLQRATKTATSFFRRWFLAAGKKAGSPQPFPRQSDEERAELGDPAEPGWLRSGEQKAAGSHGDGCHPALPGPAHSESSRSARPSSPSLSSMAPGFPRRPNPGCTVTSGPLVPELSLGATRCWHFLVIRQESDQGTACLH